MTCAFPSITVRKAVGDRVEYDLVCPADWPVQGTGLTGFEARGALQRRPEDTEALLDLTSSAEPISITDQTITVVLTGDTAGDRVSGETRRYGAGDFVIGVRVSDGTTVIAVVQINLQLEDFPSP